MRTRYSASVAKSQPTNLLLITSDQQHWRTLGALNGKIKTPNLDRLAARGVNFTRAYCPNPTCTPTRATILTGMYPSTHGAYTLGTKLDERVPTVGEHLRGNGYATNLIGKAHFQPLRSMPDCPSIESYPILRDLDFWRQFNGRGTPWYGFDHVETCRNHADESHAGQHYAIWLEEQGLSNWRDYFQPWPQDPTGHRESPLAPRKAPGHDFRVYEPWKLPAELHYTAWTGQRTIAAIDRAAERSQPFFIWSSYHDPHPPYSLPDPWFSMYPPEAMADQIGHFVEHEFDKMPPPHQWTRETSPTGFRDFNPDRRGTHGYHSHLHDEQAMRQMCAVYYGMISFMDHWIGQTLDRLEQLGQLDNTLVLFTSDHGHFFGQHGLIAKGPFHYEDVIRVPMIASLPGRLPQGTTNTHVQSLVDFAPTLLQAAGIQTPLAMQGRPMLDTWTQGGGRDHAIVENHHNGAAVHLRTLVTDRYKLTVYRGRTWGELFDLHDDPNELRNRFDDPACRDVRESMLRKLIDADLEREPAPQPRVAGA
jgi:arylsulfatase A-like enzyme